MIRDKRVLAVVPARGGSKGVPLKNIHPVLGVPLIAWVVPVLEELPLIDRAVVSTDHPEIARVARQAGLEVPFTRPEELAGDRIPDGPVLVHALEEMERLDSARYDVIVMLQPTSPLRTAADVREAIEMLVDGSWDCVWTVSPTDTKYHPLKQLTVEDQRIDFYDPEGASIVARQQLSTLYRKNGLAYVLTRDCLLKRRSINGARIGAVVCEDLHISIDTPTDIKLVEFLMKDRGFVKPRTLTDPEA